MTIGSITVELEKSEHSDINLRTAHSLLTDIYLRPNKEMVQLANEQNITVHPTSIVMAILPYLAKELGLSREEILDDCKEAFAYICLNSIHISKWATIGITL